MASPLESAINQVASIRPYIKMSDNEFERLITHDQVVQRALTMKMENGDTKVFTSFRAQHNRVLGPYKGGLRFHPSVSRDEVMALSMWMTWKTAVVGLPLGGGKGGIIVDPKQLSTTELEKLSRLFMRTYDDIIGYKIDVPAPDVNTNPEIMSWMVDECKLVKGKSGEYADVCRATFTGKPIEEGGSAGRTQATGRGGYIILEELAKLKSLEPTQTTIAVQGIGNVAYWFAKLAIDAGYKVVAISDSRGGVTTLPAEIDLSRNIDLGSNQVDSIDLDRLMTHKKTHGSLAGCEGHRTISNQELLALPVDILVPAALDGVITKDNANEVNASYIIELANGPIESDADSQLHDRGIVIIPDILANAGGVIVSYFEWMQNLDGSHWDEDTVNKKLAKTLVTAFKSTIAQQKRIKTAHISLRQAAYVEAIKRVLTQMRQQKI